MPLCNALYSVLASFVCVSLAHSSRYCDENLQLLVTLMEKVGGAISCRRGLSAYLFLQPTSPPKTHSSFLPSPFLQSPEPVIRANAIVALGDLTFRFPNLIEPWTPHLYARCNAYTHSVNGGWLSTVQNSFVTNVHLQSGSGLDLAA